MSLPFAHHCAIMRTTKWSRPEVVVLGKIVKQKEMWKQRMLRRSVSLVLGSRGAAQA